MTLTPLIHTPAGEIVMGVATGAAILYYGPELAKQLGKELDGIAKRVLGPQGVQYTLRTKFSGAYECFTCASGTMFLNAGEIWRIGETTSSRRYSDASLRRGDLQQVNEFRGNQMQIKFVEKMKIYQYIFINGQLPPGNKIKR